MWTPDEPGTNSMYSPFLILECLLRSNLSKFQLGLLSKQNPIALRQRYEPNSKQCLPDKIPLHFPSAMTWPCRLRALIEGTGTLPDYLVNGDDQKNEGPFGRKNCTKIEK